LEGFAEAHFVGEDAAEFVAVEVVEPSDAEALVGAELGFERGREWCGGEMREVAQGFAAGAPGFGRLKAGGEIFEDRLGVGEAGGRNAMRAPGGEGGGRGAVEGALGCSQFLDTRGLEEENASVGFEVVAAGVDGGADGFVGGGARANGEGDVEVAAEFGGFGDDIRGTDTRGVAFEVGGELGVKFVAEARAVFGEKIQGFVAVAEPPFAIGRLEDETVGFDEIEGGGVGRVFARREGEREKVFGAVDDQRRADGRGFGF
jgi:hypothetical protein